MTNTISPQTRARIDSLLREIAAGQHMDADTIDELRAHMEEKLLDYMRGEIPVSEDDAFVLVREHFGKPEVIRAMYQETRRRFSPQLFIRWFGAAVVALFMVTELERWLTLFVKWVVKSSWDSIQNPELLAYHAMYFLDSALDMLMICVGAIALFMVLRSWRSAEEQGKTMWYQRLPLWQLVVLTLCVLCLAFILGRYGIHSRGMAHSLLHRFNLRSGIGIGRSVGLFTFIISFRNIFEFMPLIALFWWFDRKPRSLNLTVFLLTVIFFFPVIQLINNAVRFSWSITVFARIAFHAFPRYFLLSLEHIWPSVLCLLVMYLFGAGYTSLRSHLITTLKPVRAFHD